MRDLVNQISPAVSVPALLRNGNAAVNGTGVSVGQFEAATVQFHSGTQTDGSVACKVQESDDDSTYNDAAAGDTLGGAAGANAQTIAATDDNVVKEIGYVGVKKYVRGVMTQSGATTGGTYGAIVQRGFARKQPTT